MHPQRLDLSTDLVPSLVAEVGGEGSRSIPCGERAVAGLVDVVEALAQIDDVVVSGQEAKVDRIDRDRLGGLTRTQSLQSSPHFVGRPGVH